MFKALRCSGQKSGGAIKPFTNSIKSASKLIPSTFKERPNSFGSSGQWIEPRTLSKKAAFLNGNITKNDNDTIKLLSGFHLAPTQ